MLFVTVCMCANLYLIVKGAQLKSLSRLVLNTASKTRSLAKLTGMIGQCGLGDGGEKKMRVPTKRVYTTKEMLANHAM